MPRLFILGTAAAETTPQRDYSAYAIEVGSTLFAIDVGPNITARLWACGVDPRNLSDVLVTHRHLDHLVGLPSLIDQLRLTGRRGPLTVWGLPETLHTARALLDVFGVDPNGTAVPLQLQPIALTGVAWTGNGFCVRTGPAVHTAPAVSVRVDFDGGRSIGFSGDTAPHQGMAELYTGTTLLVHECTFPDDEVAQAHADGHCTSHDVGTIARECGVPRLLLTHLSPPTDTNLDRTLAQVRAVYDGDVAAAADYQVLTI
jgi:ribonuclease BN (tRNA processing enzyme)